MFHGNQGNPIMAKYAAQPTGVECRFGDEEIIVSKTDLAGRITYANDVFLKIAGYTESEVMGEPHSIVRHPDMPRSVFKLLWDTLQAKHEIFAYVKNMAKNGDHYWVFAHVTPSYDADGAVVGYHSNRRTPDEAAVAKASGLYVSLLDEEERHDDRKVGMMSAHGTLVELLQQQGVEYDEFVHSL